MSYLCVECKYIWYRDEFKKDSDWDLMCKWNHKNNI